LAGERKVQIAERLKITKQAIDARWKKLCRKLHELLEDEPNTAA
jgi:hypothetical protein